jgi:hypothetical protein
LSVLVDVTDTVVAAHGRPPEPLELVESIVSESQAPIEEGAIMETVGAVNLTGAAIVTEELLTYAQLSQPNVEVHLALTTSSITVRFRPMRKASKSVLAGYTLTTESDAQRHTEDVVTDKTSLKRS